MYCTDCTDKILLPDAFCKKNKRGMRMNLCSILHRFFSVFTVRRGFCVTHNGFLPSMIAIHFPYPAPKHSVLSPWFARAHTDQCFKDREQPSLFLFGAGRHMAFTCLMHQPCLCPHRIMPTHLLHPYVLSAPYILRFTSPTPTHIFPPPTHARVHTHLVLNIHRQGSRLLGVSLQDHRGGGA